MAGKISIGPWWRILLVGWLMNWAGSLCAQDRPTQFVFQHIQEKDGLPINAINSFLLDRDGFLWIGTFDGVNRYDGNQFMTFKHKRHDDNSLLNNTVHDLCEDRKGNIWMVVENGVSCYEKTTGRFKNITTINNQPLGFCNNILCDRAGIIWFTSYRLGLCRYVTQTGQLDYFSYNPADSPMIPASLIAKNGLIEDPTHNGLWIAGRYGMHYFDINQRRFYNHQHNPQRLPIFQQHYVSALALDGDRLVYADNTAEKIVFYSLSKQRILKTVTPISRQPKRAVFDIATIFIDRQHNLWTSSWNYVMFHIAAGTDQVTELFHDDAKPTSIAGGFFWAGWQHPDGSVWLGTMNGISCTNPERTFYHTYNVGALFPALNDERGILSFVEDSDGSWWLGTSLRGLLHYFPQTNRLAIYKLPNRTARYPYGLPITALCAYGENLYGVAQTGLFVYNKVSQAMAPLPLPVANHKPLHLTDMLLDGDRLWVFGGSKQAHCYHIPQKKWETYPILAPTDGPFLVRSAVLDRRGQLWIDAYPEGLARFSPEGKCFILDKKSCNNQVENSLTSFTVDQTGFFWLSSNGHGLLRYDPRTSQFRQWTESDGLAYDRCLAALPDRFGNIWAGAYNKFSVFSPGKNQFLNLTLPYSEANMEYINRLYPLNNGHILATMKGYLVEFFPKKIANQSAWLPGKALISHVSIGDSVWLNHGGLLRVNLKADQTSFAVHFASLQSNTQTHAPFQYMYKLDGYEDWKQVNEAAYEVYTKMAGGDYTFRLKAITADGRQTPISALAIHIDTLFYRTTWFWILVGCSGLLLLAGFLRYRAGQIAQLHQLQVQATRLERDKTEIQYQNLINHLNPHFLFNSLTSLNSLININPREASAFLRKLSIIYRYILQNKDKELVPLENELSFVQNYIDLQKSRFDDALQITVDVPPVYRTRLIVPVTIQNLLENAIKHNSIEEDNPLIIQIYPELDYLCIVNNLQPKSFVETSNKQGLASLKSLYRYLSRCEIDTTQTDTHFIVKVPLLQAQ